MTGTTAPTREDFQTEALPLADETTPEVDTTPADEEDGDEEDGADPVEEETPADGGDVAAAPSVGMDETGPAGGQP